MEQKEAEKALYAAMDVGEAILEYGGEVSRVEDSIRRICTAYGFTRTDVFCITSSIVATAFYGEHESCTAARRIRDTGNDFDSLGQVNDLSRLICTKKEPPEAALDRLGRIRTRTPPSLPRQLLIYAAIPAAFTAFFGGNAGDCLISGLIGAILLLLNMRLSDIRFNRLFSALLSSLAGGVLSALLTPGIIGSHPALISMGNVMVFIPGVKFTNSIRDLLTGETITGLISLAESLLLSVVVALGFAVPAMLL